MNHTAVLTKAAKPVRIRPANRLRPAKGGRDARTPLATGGTRRATSNEPRATLLVARVALGSGDAGGAVPDELVIYQPGWTEYYDGRRALVDDEAARSILAAFERGGRDLVIDYEHGSIKPENRAEGAAPAAGWIKDLTWDPQRGLVARVEWNERARGYITSREYRFLSPAALVEEASGRVVELWNVALTNEPLTLGLQPIAASRYAGLSARGASLVEDDGSQAAEFLEGIAATKAFFDYAYEAFIPVKQFLDRSDEMGREAWLRAADALLQQARPGPISRAIELIELLSEVQEHRDLIETTEDVAPAAQASAGNASASARARSAFVATTRHSYAVEAARRGNTPICPESSWVNAALRDAGRRELTNAELNGIVGRNHGSVLKLNPGHVKQGEIAMMEQIAEALGLPPESGIELILEAIGSLQAALEEGQGANAVTASRAGRGGIATSIARGARQRPAVILAARRAFAAEAADPSNRIITSERNWVNLALRDAKCRGLTENELATYGIKRNAER